MGAEITEKGTEGALMTSGTVADGSLASSELEAAGLNPAAPPHLGVAGLESAAIDAASLFYQQTRDLFAAELRASRLEQQTRDLLAAELRASRSHDASAARGCTRLQ